MTTSEKDSDKRANERLDMALQISLPDQKWETINISATGVYFEVITNDMEAFSPGAAIPIQINAATTTPGLEERVFKLKGNGTVVRNDIKNVTSFGNRLGVALELRDKLNISMG